MSSWVESSLEGELSSDKHSEKLEVSSILFSPSEELAAGLWDRKNRYDSSGCFHDVDSLCIDVGLQVLAHLRQIKKS